MRYDLVMFRQLVVFCAMASSLAAADAVPLFNGKDLQGWKMVGLGRFVVENGLLKTEGGMGLLYYAGQKFGNQTIRVVYKTSGDRGNSGVYIRMPEAPPDAWYGVHNGYEVQIDAKGDEWHSTGALYSISKASRRAQKADGEWNTLEIELAGPVTRVKLNGELVNEYKEGTSTPERKQHYEPTRGPRPDMGYIGVQNHDPDSKVYFKEISVIGGAKPSGTVPEFTQVSTADPAGSMTRSDRDFLLSYYHSTRRQVADTVAGLSEEQLNYKPAADRWSVRDILEHLVLTEDALFGMVMQNLRTPIAAPEAKVTDEQFVARMKDRSQKAEAPPMLRPEGKWKTKEELLTEFRSRRDKSLAWINTTKEDLRSIYFKSPGGTMQGYQAFLILPGHVERHLAQAREVMASPAFPKK